MNKPNIFDLIYEPYELSAEAKKRNQMELLKEVVYELKRDFNAEFNALEKFKED